MPKRLLPPLPVPSSAVAVALCLPALALGPGTAVAGACAQRQSVVERLEKTYGESRRGVGLAGDSSGVVEIFASDETGTWTITVTLPSGMACLVASGQNWSPATLPAGAKGDPA